MGNKTVKISQSFIKDALKTKSLDPKIQCKPQYCPQFLKHRYIDGLQTKPSPAMQLGNFFEWHLLGATRNGIEPLLPKKGVRDLRPTKSASKNAMLEYIMLKANDAIIKGTGKRVDLKPNSSASKPALIEYISSKGVFIPEKSTKEDLLIIINTMVDDLGEPEITQEDLFAFIQTLPEDLSEGEKTTQQLVIELIIDNSRSVLSKMGLDVDEGGKQVKLETDYCVGHLDWVHKDLKDPNKKAIYDVKYTQTQYDDWRNGWFDPNEKEDAKLQASHYIYLYYELTGEYIPFYFLVFGENGWIRVLKYEITTEAFSMHEVLISEAKVWLKEFIKTKWKARPEYNRCLTCDFNDVCKFRANLPEIEKIVM